MTSKKFQCNFIEITLLHGSSPVNSLHVCRISLLRNTLQGMFLMFDCNQEKFFYYYCYYCYYYQLFKPVFKPTLDLSCRASEMHFQLKGSLKYFRIKRIAKTKTFWPWCWLYNDFFIKKTFFFVFPSIFYLFILHKKWKGYGSHGSPGFTHPI